MSKHDDNSGKPYYQDLLPDAASVWFPLIDTMPMWFWTCDADYALTYVGSNVTSVTGIEPKALLGLCILSQEQEGTYTNLGTQAYHDVLLSREPFQSLCYERRLESGDRAVLMDSGVPVFDDAGGFLGYHGVTFHLSEAVQTAGETASLIHALRSRAELLERELSDRNRQLEASNKLLKEVVQAMGEGLIVTDGTGADDLESEVVMVNPAYRQMFDMTKKEVGPGSTLRDVISKVMQRCGVTPSEEGISYVMTRMATGEPWVADIKTMDRATSVKAARRPSGGFVIVHTDVTDLRARQMMLTKARDQAEVANQAKSNFLATISHEIRTPMNGVVGMADLLAETELSPEQLGFVETIRTSAVALTVLISDILDFSKVEAGHVTIQHDAFDLHAVVTEISVLMKPLAQVKALEYKITLDPELPKTVKGDALRLRQILLNLLGNAVKFTMNGGVQLSVAVQPPDGMVVFDVQDTGIGIPEDKLDTVFAPFEQVDSGLQREFEGTGLGLSITRILVEAMGGQITVTSQEGVGSTFKLALPLEPVDMRIEESDARPPAKLDCSGLHILVAEDNKTNQLVVRRMLEHSGAKITAVRNGHEACIAYESGQFDVVLMDISMPVMNGLDACRAIRKFETEHDRPHCPVIALTGNAFERDRKASHAAGMDGFLTKPVRLTDLATCLSKHLNMPDDRSVG